MIPGEVLHPEDAGPILLNAAAAEAGELVEVRVLNTADRPVQVGSHYHFAEANPGLAFDRAAAHGRRLCVPAGTAVRFEPGIPVDVVLVRIAGRRTVPGLRGETAGPLDPILPEGGRLDG